MYGSVAEKSFATIEARSEEEAIKIALESAENGELQFSNNHEAMDGWEYQVEDIKEIKT